MEHASRQLLAEKEKVATLEFRGRVEILKVLGEAVDLLRAVKAYSEIGRSDLVVIQTEMATLIEETEYISGHLARVGMARRCHAIKLAPLRLLLDYQSRREMRENKARVLVTVAGLLLELQRPDLALAALGQARETYAEFKNEKEEANALAAIGMVLARSTWDESMDAFNQALKIHKRLGDLHGEATDLTGIGDALTMMSKYTEAIDCYNQALKIFQKLGIKDGEANALVSIGNALNMVGRWVEAGDYCNRALRIFREAGETRGEAKTLGTAGNVLLNLAKWSEAIENYKQALILFEKTEDTRGEAKILTNMGIVFNELGRWSEAIENYRKALEIDRELGDKQGEATDYGNIGLALGILGQYSDAMQHLNQALNVYKELGYRQGEARISGGLGDISVDLGNFEDALRYYNECIKLYDSLRFGIHSSELRVDFMTRYMGAYEGAVYAVYRKEIEPRLQSKSSVVRREIGWDSLKECLNYAELSKCSVLVEGLTNSLLCEVGRGKRAPSVLWDRYVNKLRRIMGIEDKIVEIEYRLKSKDIDAILFQNERIKLEDEFKSASKELNEVQIDLYSTDGDPGLISAPPGLDIVAACLKTFSLEVDVSWGVLEFIVLPRWNKLLAFLLFREGGARSEALQEVASHEIIKWVSEVKDNLDTSELEKYCMHQEKIVQLMREGNLLYQIGKDIEAEKKFDEAELTLSQLSDKLSSELIFGKIREVLERRSFTHLIVVPHRWLHNVPFEALKVGDAGEPLGTAFAVSRSHSLRLASTALQERKKRICEYFSYPSSARLGAGTRDVRIVAFANPTGDLHGARSEVKAVEEILVRHTGRSQKSLEQECFFREEGCDVRRSKFRNHMNSPSPWHFVHYAGHAEFVGNEPMMSYLKLHVEDIAECEACSEKTHSRGDALGEENLGKRSAAHSYDMLTAYDILMCSGDGFKGCPLVYLSACETGLSGLKTGDEAFGLIRALMLRGFTTIIASYWPVDDDCAPIFAGEFYESYLIKGRSAAESLRDARRKVYENKKFHNQASSWATFTLYGDPFRKHSQFTGVEYNDEG